MEASDDEDEDNADVPARQLREVQHFDKVMTWYGTCIDHANRAHAPQDT